MPTSPRSAEPLEERANRLYWHSTDTIDEIVSQLGISRSALYSAVNPLPADAACPECGEALVYMNRSQRAAGRATCIGCGRRFDTGELEPAGAGAAPDEGEDEVGRLDRWRGELAAVSPERALLVGAAAVVGIAAGAVLARLLRSR